MRRWAPAWKKRLEWAVDVIKLCLKCRTEPETHLGALGLGIALNCRSGRCRFLPVYQNE
ncbi:hypothetical protein ATPR_2490 [Acetobacter tropicalis NBRC 101654]|uniref:Uncharacterized protein n=1 Tax=Acetobacter tropicalis NBRC 101654 TaxID=749388 RepID=F7VGJ1_9PROT|nr:hypothetical protein ATPR_2490 [Acetobacter tropicalis NBRC 101654]